MRKDLIGVTLLEERKKQGKTIKEVAEEMLVGTTTISSMERGLPNVADDKYIEYAKLLGKAELLFGIVDDMTKRERVIMEELHHIEDVLSAIPSESLKRVDNIPKLHMFRDASVFATFLRGRSYFEQKNYAKSKEHLEKALKILDQCPNLANSNIPSICLNDLGRIAFYKADYELANHYTEQAITVFVPDGKRLYYKPYLFLNQVIYLEMLGRIEEACQLLEHLLNEIDRFKTNSFITIQVYERYAMLLVKLGMPLKALEYAQEGLQIAWENQSFRRLMSVWSTIAEILFILGRIDESKIRYQKALDLSQFVSDNPSLIADTHFGFGKLLIQTKEYEAAKAQLEKAITFSQQTTEVSIELDVYSTLGQLQLKLGELDEAEKTFRKVEELILNNNRVEVDIYLHLCEFYKCIENEHKLRLYQQLICEKLMEGGMSYGT